VNALLYLAGAVAIVATVAVVLQRKAVHALLYLIVSFFALAMSMLALGAAFAAALEVLVYAGAILVLFVFVVMMLGAEGSAPRARAWIGPALLSAILLGELAYCLLAFPSSIAGSTVQPEVTPKQVGLALFDQYALCAEIAAFLLIAGLVGAYHLGRRLPASGEGAA
jgi:NADH-quinone oxidoreductase subunit J